MAVSGAGEVIEITRLTKIGGPLTKRISLLPDGTLKSDGSACLTAVPSVFVSMILSARALP